MKQYCTAISRVSRPDEMRCEFGCYWSHSADPDQTAPRGAFLEERSYLQHCLQSPLLLFDALPR